jgi:hypothetical protein
MTDNLVPLVGAIYQVTGHKVHRVTAARWARCGVGGIRLRSWTLGGRRLTTLAAVREFIEATSDEASPSLPEVSDAS